MQPIAQPDCMSPAAFPRCSAGHDSATSTEPADQTPPIPVPTSVRHNEQRRHAGDGCGSPVKPE